MRDVARTRWDVILEGSVGIPANEALGFRIEETPDPTDHIALSWRVPAELCNSAGNLQGGVLAAFADALLGGATSAHLPEDTYPALAEMKISIYRPARAAMTLRGRGYVVKAGKRVLFAEAEVRGFGGEAASDAGAPREKDPDGALIARASGTEIPAPG